MAGRFLGVKRRDPRRDGRRSAIALALSAGLHLAFAAWLISRVPTPPQLPEIERPPGLDVEIVRPPELEPSTPAAPAVPAPAGGGQHRAHRTHGAASQETAMPATPAAPRGVEDDVPHGAHLELPEILLPHLAGDLADLEGGHTFHQDPRAGGRSNAEKMAEAHARIETWFEDDAAEQHVKEGLVDPWFGELKRRFEHDATEPKIAPQGVIAKVGSALVDQYLADMRRFGSSGNPNATPPPDRPAIFPSGATGISDELVTLDPGRAPISALELIGQKLSLVAVVDLRQDSDGSLLSAQLIVRSSSADFDRYVLDIIPKSMEMVSPPPDAGLGFHANGSHTVWEFAGKLMFARDLRELNLARDGWYFLPLNILSGIHFDEVTGYVGMLVNPYYKCQVRLLRVY
jgi:hypothetical protein